MRGVLEMTDVKTIKDLVSNYNPQDSRKTRAGKQEMTQRFLSYVEALKTERTPFQVTWKRSHSPLSLSVINSQTESLLAVFVIEDTDIEEVISLTEGVYFYGY